MIETVWGKLFFKAHLTIICEFNVSSDMEALLSIRLRADVENPCSISVFPCERQFLCSEECKHLTLHNILFFNYSDFSNIYIDR